MLKLSKAHLLTEEKLGHTILAYTFQAAPTRSQHLTFLSPTLTKYNMLQHALYSPSAVIIGIIPEQWYPGQHPKEDYPSGIYM